MTYPLKTFFYGMVVALILFGVPQGSFSDQLPKTLDTRDGAQMALVPAGPFLMGSPEGEGFPPEYPQHKVELDAFYMDTTEATNARYAKFLNEIRAPEGKEGEIWNWVVLRSDLEYPERANWWPTEISFKRGSYQATPGRENHPLITVSWWGAKAFCEYYGKRLPTEAEWEKAARGGLEGKTFPWGDAFPTGGVTFNHRWMTNQEPVPTTPVASYSPNGYGLYDMVGNVWEWCADGYDENYYAESPAKNPQGANIANRKVLRGGSWFNPAQFIRVAQRNFNPPEGTQDAIGFRCAMDATPEALRKAAVLDQPAADADMGAGVRMLVPVGQPTSSKKAPPLPPQEVQAAPTPPGEGGAVSQGNGPAGTPASGDDGASTPQGAAQHGDGIGAGEKDVPRVPEIPSAGEQRE